MTMQNDPFERALLVGLYPGGSARDAEWRLDELQSLVAAAGAISVGRTFQPLRSPKDICAATYIGHGKVWEVVKLADACEADFVVFDNELSPAQIRELEKRLGRRVIDRSELILDIFALRARTREARLQVELAQLQYTAPRLRGMWTHLERQANSGGSRAVGNRGPGEQQIELDRRIIGDRVVRLRGELSHLQRRKKREVAARGKRDYCVGLVGYTNAGKSTLMNALTGADRHVEDKLFATLDTSTRRWQVEPGLTAMVSDTVGFVRDLPHKLVASFRSTLEEALNADLLLHVIDASHPQAPQQIEAVNAVLEELGCEMDRVMCVLNKVDRAAGPHDLLELRPDSGKAICVSALRGDGIAKLSEAVALDRRRDSVWVRIRIPAGEGRVQALAHARAHIRRASFDRGTWVAELNLTPSLLARFRHLAGEITVEPLNE